MDGKSLSLSNEETHQEEELLSVSFSSSSEDPQEITQTSRILHLPTQPDNPKEQASSPYEELSQGVLSLQLGVDSVV